MRKSALLLLLAFSVVGSAVDKVEYTSYVNGSEQSRAGKTILEYSDSTLKISTAPAGEQSQLFPVQEATYIDMRKGFIYRNMINKMGLSYTVRTSFAELQPLQFEEEPAEIEVGKKKYTCKKARVVLFSNTIEMWYTDELRIKGSPLPRNGLPGGLVLKWVRNGNTELRATAIQLDKKPSRISLLPDDFGTFTDDAGYYARSVENFVTTVNVFNDEQICWGWDKANPAEEHSDQVFHFVNGTVIARKVTLPAYTGESSVYAELTQYSNGDAYDRTGTVFMIPVSREQSFLDGLRKGKDALPVYKTSSSEYQGVVRTATYEPLVELMRFFTSFGVGHFNDKRTVEGIQWEEKSVFKQDISQFRSILRGEVWIGVFIGNYDKGGHKVSLDLKFHPHSMRPSTTMATEPFILPLFNTLNVMEMGGQNYGTMFGRDSLTVAFTVPEGLKNLQLRYISTGHGGWGNGDEFVPKENTILVDGKVEYRFVPWREDCATYRKWNPASGNAWNGLSSSDYSRSGWCPGTITNPVTIDLSHLSPGAHVLRVAIPLGKPEGSSFSSWNVSGVLVGE